MIDDNDLTLPKVQQYHTDVKNAQIITIEQRLYASRQMCSRLNSRFNAEKESIEQFENRINKIALSEFEIYFFAKVNKLSDKTAREKLWSYLKSSSSRDFNSSTQLPPWKVSVDKKQSDRMQKSEKIQFMKGLKPKPKQRKPKHRKSED